MSANRAYRIIVSREGRVPALLADRVDHIEIVEIDSGEVVLYWDLPAREASRRARRLRDDLGLLSPEEFFERWSAVE
jgi:hypothetical protein